MKYITLLLLLSIVSCKAIKVDTNTISNDSISIVTNDSITSSTNTNINIDEKEDVVTTITENITEVISDTINSTTTQRTIIRNIQQTKSKSIDGALNIKADTVEVTKSNVNNVTAVTNTNKEERNYKSTNRSLLLVFLIVLCILIMYVIKKFF